MCDSSKTYNYGAKTCGIMCAANKRKGRGLIKVFLVANVVVKNMNIREKGNDERKEMTQVGKKTI